MPACLFSIVGGCVTVCSGALGWGDDWERQNLIEHRDYREEREKRVKV